MILENTSLFLESNERDRISRIVSHSLKKRLHKKTQRIQKKNESLHIDTSHSEMTDLARILSHPLSNDWTNRSSYFYLYCSSMCIVFTQKTDTYEQIRTQNRELH